MALLCDALNAKLEKKIFGYVETAVPCEHFREMPTRRHDQLGQPQLKYPFYACDTKGATFSANLSYHILENGIGAFSRLENPFLPSKLAVVQEKCPWREMAVPAQWIEPCPYENGEGLLLYLLTPESGGARVRIRIRPRLYARTVQHLANAERGEAAVLGALEAFASTRHCTNAHAAGGSGRRVQGESGAALAMAEETLRFVMAWSCDE